MPVVGNQGELAFGIAKLDPTERRLHFPATTEFLEDIRQGAERYCLAEGAGHVAGLKSQILRSVSCWTTENFICCTCQAIDLSRRRDEDP